MLEKKSKEKKKKQEEDRKKKDTIYIFIGDLSQSDVSPAEVKSVGSMTFCLYISEKV